MINKDRIVPIQRTDYLSLIATVLKIANVDVTVLKAETVEGDFTVTENGTYIADQPVHTLAIADGVTAATVYFVADFGFAGITNNGAAVEADVVADAVALQTAVLASGAVTVTNYTP